VPPEEQRQELGAFLRVRRAALRPEDVGLPQGVNHRRTPGLRREELAQLAGISVSWYTRLEQGKDVQPSAKAVARVAQALQLTAAEREYLLALARRDPSVVQPAANEPVSATLRDVLEAQGDNPAYLIDARLNLLAWNRAAISVFGFAEDLAAAPVEERNLLWLIFADNARTWLVDRERHAKLLLAQFRDASRHQVNEPWFGRFVQRLQQRSPEFAMVVPVRCRAGPGDREGDRSPDGWSTDAAADGAPGRRQQPRAVPDPLHARSRNRYRREAAEARINTNSHRWLIGIEHHRCERPWVGPPARGRSP
jgi:transcriptional regulator with XRE-family HTH domain